MTIRIYNSLTQQKEDLIPLHDQTINMYSCGVTVYDQCHIGHARSLFVFDMIRRYLVFRGLKVNFVRNITDVDDKIIQKAVELGKSSLQVAEENIQSYYRDLAALGIQKADCEPKATENIPDMVEHIQGLIARSHAYAVDGDVYFSVRSFADYGKLSGQSIEKMLDAVRIEKDSKKKDPLDFALWKKSKAGEPSWSSPWSQGRPGWHIECSCMSMKHLKTTTLDIHAGGRDLIFPHHENEIAQSEALTQKPFAKYWMHHGLLTINGQKMAKSAGNFITVSQALQKYGVDELKILFLFSHYSSAIDFTDDKLADAHKALQRFKILLDKTARLTHTPGQSAIKFPFAPIEFLEKRQAEFLEAMDDDFNTPRALSSLFELVNETNKYLDTQTESGEYVAVAKSVHDFLYKMGRTIFGLFSDTTHSNLSAQEQELLDKRQKARTGRDFKKSDEFRDQLKKKGITVEDTKDGQVWRRA